MFMLVLNADRWMLAGAQLKRTTATVPTPYLLRETRRRNGTGYPEMRCNVGQGHDYVSFWGKGKRQSGATWLV